MDVFSLDRCNHDIVLFYMYRSIALWERPYASSKPTQEGRRHYGDGGGAGVCGVGPSYVSPKIAWGAAWMGIMWWAEGTGLDQGPWYCPRCSRVFE